MLMKLSVIIPTLNAGRYLPNLLERLSSQTVSDKEETFAQFSHR